MTTSTQTKLSLSLAKYLLILSLISTVILPWLWFASYVINLPFSINPIQTELAWRGSGRKEEV